MSEVQWRLGSIDSNAPASGDGVSFDDETTAVVRRPSPYGRGGEGGRGRGRREGGGRAGGGRSYISSGRDKLRSRLTRGCDY